MKTWSIAGVIDNATIGFVHAASLGAVVVQGIFDAFTHQPNPNSHPIPGCPDAVECRTHGCAGDCSEALEAEAEAEEGSEPRLNDGLTPFDPQWKMTIADGSPPCTCPCINCCNSAHWMCHGEGVEIDTVHDDAVSCPCGDTCPPECDRDAFACVQTFGPASEHAEALRRNKTSRAVSADLSRDSAAETGSPPSPSAACKDPSPTGDEGPAGDSAIPTTPPAGRPDSFSDGVLAAANIIGDAAQKQWRELLDSPVPHPKAHLLDVAELLDGLTQQLRDHANEYAPK